MHTITIGLANHGSMGADWNAEAYERAARRVIARRYPGAAVETSARAEGVTLAGESVEEGDASTLSRAVFDEYCGS